LSEAAVRAYHLPIEKIHVLIRENQPENVGTGDLLLYDKNTRNSKIFGLVFLLFYVLFTATSLAEEDGDRYLVS
jgi:hypothetical protein